MRNGRSGALALVLAGALTSAVPALAERGDPLEDAAVQRIRAGFKVDGIALFDAQAEHAARMGVCAASIFAGLRWCVSGQIEETRGGVAYVKTTGYNADGEGRIVYAISTRRGYPLKRDEFEAVIHGIGERFGAGAAVHALRKTGEGEVDSLIAVWGGLRLVHLGEAEYATVETGASLKRGHLVDHRFDLVASARQRDPVYKIEGEAGYILHLRATEAGRADIVARVVYPAAFAAPPAKPSGAIHPLAAESAQRPAAAEPGDERARRIEAERALASERLLREEAERKAEEERAARAEAERRRDAASKAAEELKKRLDEAERAGRGGPDTEREGAEGDPQRADADTIERERAESEARRRRDEAARKAAEERLRKAEEQRKAVEEAARRAEAARAEAERRAVDERRRKEEAERQAAAAEAERQAAERARKSEAERKADWLRAATEEAKRAGAIWSLVETQDRVAEERTLRAQAVFADGERAAIEVAFECTVGRSRRLRASARGFDRKSGESLAFRAAGEGVGVPARVSLDHEPPQDGLLFREGGEDTVSILELPVTAADLDEKMPRARVWLRHQAVAFALQLGEARVTAAVTPYADNLRRVLEACAE
jgi:hypothetical protein